MTAKAHVSTTYTKRETDTALALNANTGVSYTIAQSDAHFSLEADQATTYTKTETDTALAQSQS